VRIVLLNHFFYPDEAATAQLVTDMARYVSDHSDHEIIAVCGRTRYAAEKPFPTGWSDHGKIKIRRLWCTDFGTQTILGRLVDYVTFLAHAWFFLTFILRHDVIVVMTSPPLVSALGGWCHYVHKSVLIYWTMDLYPEIAFTNKAKRESFAYRCLQKLARWIDRSTAVHVVLGKHMAKVIEDRHHHFKPKTLIIPNWTVSEPLITQERAFRRTHGLEDKFVLMYSGNFGKAHDWRTLAEGFELLAQSQKSVLLLVVGYGASYEAFKVWHHNKTEIPIRFLKHQPRADLHDMLSSANVHIVTQKPEFDGLVVPSKFYGIAAVGRPVLFIGSSTNEIADVITEFDLGAVIAPGAIRDFTERVETWIKSPSLLATPSGNMVQWNRNHGQKIHSLNKWLELFESLSKK